MEKKTAPNKQLNKKKHLKVSFHSSKKPCKVPKKANLTLCQVRQCIDRMEDFSQQNYQNAKDVNLH